MTPLEKWGIAPIAATSSRSWLSKTLPRSSFKWCVSTDRASNRKLLQNGTGRTTPRLPFLWTAMGTTSTEQTDITPVVRKSHVLHLNNVWDLDTSTGSSFSHQRWRHTVDIKPALSRLVWSFAAHDNLLPACLQIWDDRPYTYSNGPPMGQMQSPGRRYEQKKQLSSAALNFSTRKRSCAV